MSFYLIFNLLSHFILVFSLAFYLITNLQWYDYRLNRVIFKHKRYLWHILYFLIPLFAYYLTDKFFWIYFYFAYLPSLFAWHKKLDRALNITARVKRFFIFLFLAVLFQDMLCLSSHQCQVFGVFLPLLASVLASNFFEKIQMSGFEKQAKRKLNSINELRIIAITASYGKTSMKNFLYHLIKDDYRVYKTPRSVNTINGIIKDINESLPLDSDIYIVEAGARQKGDIYQIASFLDHHFAIIGKIGAQHIEYFKTLENIRDTKMELLGSKRLVKALVHKSANVKPDDRVEIFGSAKIIKSSIDGIEFEIDINGKNEMFKAPILGDFNIINLEAVIKMALILGVDLQKIKDRVSMMPQVEHRLQKIQTEDKIIIDDSFNGNLEGMISSYELVKGFEGRKVIVTPGLYEATKEDNEKLSAKIDEVFDLVIITGKQNASTLFVNIKNTKKIVLKDKSKLQDTLFEETKRGDIILFSNDAPNFM